MDSSKPCFLDGLTEDANFVEEFSTPGEEVANAAPLPSSNSKTGQVKHELRVRERFLIDYRIFLLEKKKRNSGLAGFIS